MIYRQVLTPIINGPPILADHPYYMEPLITENRFLAPPLVNDPCGALHVRAWRYSYNARGIIEFENRLDPAATAVLVVHPWGIDDDHGMRTPEPAGCAFFCTKEKNALAHDHMREVVAPFLQRLRGQINMIGYSLPGTEDPIRRKLYASALTEPGQLDSESGERELKVVLDDWTFAGGSLYDEVEVDDNIPVYDYFKKITSTDAYDHYNRPGYWGLPMPVSTAIQYNSSDRVFYDAEGYAKVRDYLRSRGVRHVLLAGYCTDMCVIATTCGYKNLQEDFNIFLVGDATLATYPGSDTPRFATQVALANAALEHLVTQVNWISLQEQ